MSYNFLNGFVDELTKTAGPTDLAKPPGQTMEVKIPKPPKPLQAPKPATMESKPAAVLPKTAGVKDMLGTMGSAVKKMVTSDKAVRAKVKAGDLAAKAKFHGAKAKGRGQDLAGKAKAYASTKGHQWNALSPAEKKRYMAIAGAGTAAGVAAGAGASKLAGEDKAGAMIKEVLENAKGKNRPESKSGDSVGGEYGAGGGLSNFEGKTAPKFNKKYNPTDMPQAFGKR